LSYGPGINWWEKKSEIIIIKKKERENCFCVRQPLAILSFSISLIQAQPMHGHVLACEPKAKKKGKPQNSSAQPLTPWDGCAPLFYF
jgi:hypothetical protein